jgi:hypothetical protein
MIIYFNLRQGLRALTKFHYTCPRFVYFRSTDIEQKLYDRLLWSVPDEMLFFLARGFEVYVVDCSTKKYGKVERIFIPVLRDLLEFLWFKKEVREKKLKEHFRIALETLERNQLLKTRFLIWRKHLNTEEVRLKALTVKVKRELEDGEINAFLKNVERELARKLL